MNKVKLLEHNSEAQKNWGGHENTREYLKVGEIYEVRKKEVHSWHTRLYLKGFPDIHFNSVCFEEFDLNKKHWFAIVKFDLENHKGKLKIKHPDWSEKQLACCLYWQGTIRKSLRTICNIFMYQNPGTIYNLIPEALGVNVIKTAQSLGIPIKRNITDTIYKIALIGTENSAEAK